MKHTHTNTDTIAALSHGETCYKHSIRRLARLVTPSILKTIKAKKEADLRHFIKTVLEAK